MNDEQTAREELTRITYSARMLQEQGKALQEKILELQQTAIEIIISVNSIKSIKESKQGENAIIPLGAGAFVKANLSKKGSVLVETGAGVVVETSEDEAAKILEKHLENVTGVRSKLEGDLMNASQQLASLDKQASLLIEKSKKG